LLTSSHIWKRLERKERKFNKYFSKTSFASEFCGCGEALVDQISAELRQSSATNQKDSDEGKRQSKIN
jgi:hypothetical protein